MKKITLLITLLTFSLGFAQVDLPHDYETSPVTSDFTGFDGGTATVEAVAAPQSTGNTSNNLLKIVRDGGQAWAGAFINLQSNMDFSSNRYITARIWTDAPIGTKIMFKTENQADAGINSGEKDVFTTVTGDWETLVFDFDGVTAANQNRLVMIPDNGNLGDGSATSTFFFDDVVSTNTLSTGNNELIEARAFPNPSSTSWVITTPNNTIKSVQVFNLLGKQVVSRTFNGNEANISVESLSSGIYLAKVTTDVGTTTMKLIRL
jgi:hypothetical protein